MATKIFISHASEDKDEFVRPLASALNEEDDISVWYDEYSLTWGDSLRESIDKGLSECDYAIVVFSEFFFSKSWPKAELDGLFGLELGRGKLILPIWKGVNHDDVEKFSPLLAGRLAISSDIGIDKIVESLKNLIQNSQRAVEIDHQRHLALFTDKLKMRREIQHSNSIINSYQGVNMVARGAALLIEDFGRQLDAVIPEIMNDDHEKIKNDSKFVCGYFLFGRRVRLIATYKNNVINNCKEAILTFSLDELNDDSYPSFFDPIYDFSFKPYINFDSNILWLDETSSDPRPIDKEGLLRCAIERLAYKLSDIDLER